MCGVEPVWSGRGQLIRSSPPAWVGTSIGTKGCSSPQGRLFPGGTEARCSYQMCNISSKQKWMGGAAAPVAGESLRQPLWQGKTCGSPCGRERPAAAPCHSPWPMIAPATGIALPQAYPRPCSYGSPFPAIAPRAGPPNFADDHQGAEHRKP